VTLKGHFHGKQTLSPRRKKTSLHDRADVPALGRCNEIDHETGGPFQNDMLKVMCVVPQRPSRQPASSSPISVQIGHWDNSSGYEYDPRFPIRRIPGCRQMSRRGPRFFHLTPGDPSRRTVDSGRREPSGITASKSRPWREIAREVVSYELRDIQLSTFLVNAGH